MTVRPDDLRLLRGRGRFVADRLAAGELHLAIARSPVAHGRLGPIDGSRARAIPGVRLVLDGMAVAEHLDPFGSVVHDAPSYLGIALDRVRYVGEPIALVLADDRYIAEDGVDALVAPIEPLPVTVSVEHAIAPGAPELHEGYPGNVVWRRRYDYGEPDRAFEQAARVVTVKTRFPKYNSTPLETYGLVADWDAQGRELLVESNFQGPFSLHTVLCKALRLETSEVRLHVAEDVGGSFGVKAMMYPYIALAAVASKVAGRPVRWIEDRVEHLHGSASGTARSTRAEAAVDADGRVQAVRLEVLEDVGAYLRAPEPSCVMRTVTTFAGPYAIAHGTVDVSVAVTNTLPTGLNRGYGGQQNTFTLERLMDAVARDLSIEPSEVRRRNLLRPADFPYVTPTGTSYDSGDYLTALDRALELSDYCALRARPRGPGPLVGVGLATAVHSAAANMGYVTLALDPDVRAHPRYREKSGTREVARAHIDPSGRVYVEISTAGCGQGHRETVRQIVADALGLEATEVRAIDAVDSWRDAWSVSTGSYSSRFAVMGANAALLAAERLRDDLCALAALQLGVGRNEIEWADGAAHVRTGGRVSLKALAGAVHWDSGSLPPGSVPTLDVLVAFTADGLAPPDGGDRINAALTYGFMADVAVVEIDRDTLIPRLVHYVAVHDVGRALHEQLVAGQVHGGVVHGMGGALYEHLAYGNDGALLTGAGFFDYLSPTAREAPLMTVAHADAPSPTNPLGVKGAGESSAMSAPAAIAAAVEDALRESGLQVNELPVSPAVLWEATRRVHVR